jgi:hypothetical protein
MTDAQPGAASPQHGAANPQHGAANPQPGAAVNPQPGAAANLQPAANPTPQIPDGNSPAASISHVVSVAAEHVDSFMLNPLAQPRPCAVSTSEFMNEKANNEHEFPMSRFIAFADDFVVFIDCANELPQNEALMAQAAMHYFVLLNEFAGQHKPALQNAHACRSNDPCQAE